MVNVRQGEQRTIQERSPNPHAYCSAEGIHVHETRGRQQEHERQLQHELDRVFEAVQSQVLEVYVLGVRSKFKAFAAKHSCGARL